MLEEPNYKLMARLPITPSTLKKLFALSGNCCAFPGCTEKMIDEAGAVIGQVCHIEAANEGGQRYNYKQNDEDRRSFENLLVMCNKHHKITDNVQVYLVESLVKIKTDHENRFKNKKDQYKVSDKQLESISQEVNNSVFNNTSSGKQFVNQGQNQIVNIHQGLSAVETNQIVETRLNSTVSELKQNFIHLSRDAQKTVDTRIANFITEDFEPKFIDLSLRIGGLEEKLKNPDVQYSFNQVLQAVGRRFSPDFNQSLANLMIARIESEDNSTEALIYNEAISVFPRLTSAQLGILSFTFLTHSVKSDQSFSSTEEIEDWLESRFGWVESKKFGILKIKDIDFSHLEYSTAAIIASESFDFEQIFSENNTLVKNILRLPDQQNYHIFSKLKNVHDETQIKHLRLTSVGTVLAIHWLKIIADLDFETGLWLSV